MNNPQLFDHGIQMENSDIRAHVCPGNKTVYVFETKNGRLAIETHNPEQKAAMQQGVDYPTAMGWLVKPNWIVGLRQLKYVSWPRWVEYDNKWNTSQKGKFAVDCVVSLLKIGRFPIWIDTEESDREKVQIKGTDIIFFANKRIQVKCDTPVWNTGNLYLQSAELNPLKRH